MAPPVDIVERIRKLRYVHVPVASELMAEAADEIERLRLTNVEREAIELSISKRLDMDAIYTLRKLLERLHT
jgi:wyosine [tRNA(Phe)-imidazoG37] synthetase (radical SAM superfamily)